MGKAKKKNPIVVEDHGNGFMVIGVLSVTKALKVLEDYVDDTSEYIWATPTFYEGRGSVWLGGHVGANWEGATDMYGRQLPR
jgi:hypothetical protein